MSYFRSRAMLIGKSLATKDWERPSVLMKARKLARSGSTLKEIMEALGWEINPRSALLRLRKKNITPFDPTCCAHRGYQTHFPCDENINQTSFTAKYRRSA